MVITFIIDELDVKDGCLDHGSLGSTVGAALHKLYFLQPPSETETSGSHILHIYFREYLQLFHPGFVLWLLPNPHKRDH